MKQLEWTKNAIAKRQNEIVIESDLGMLIRVYVMFLTKHYHLYMNN